MPTSSPSGGGAGVRGEFFSPPPRADDSVGVSFLKRQLYHLKRDGWKTEKDMPFLLAVLSIFLSFYLSIYLSIYIYVVGTFRVYFVPLGNAIIIEKNQQKSHLMDLSFHWLLVKRDQLVSRPYSDQE